jgi:hypothetical protein
MQVVTDTAATSTTQPKTGDPTMTRSIMSTSTARHPDAELLRLGARLTEATLNATYACRTAASPAEHQEADEFMEEAGVIVDEMVGLKATAHGGVLVKRQAIAWLHSGDPVTAEDLSLCGEPSTAASLILGLLSDVDRMRTDVRPSVIRARLLN